MRKLLTFFALAILCVAAVGIIPTGGALKGGVESGIQQYDCGSSCHVTLGGATITMSAPSLNLTRGQSVTITVTVSGSNSGPILGVMLVSLLDPVAASVPSAAGWTITADPSGSGTNNYYEMTNYAGDTSLQWTLTAPQSDGTYTLYARVHHGGGSEPQYENYDLGLAFVVGAGTVPGAPSVVITSPLDGATVQDTMVVDATIQSSAAIAYVLLMIDDVVVDNKSTSPFRWDVDTLNYSNGVHALNVTAYDVDGNSGFKNITFNVNNVVEKKEIPTWVWIAAGGAVVIVAGIVSALFLRKRLKAMLEGEAKELSATERGLLAPLLRTKPSGYALLVLSGLGAALFATMWYVQMTSGLVVTGMRDYGMPLRGSPWGIYIVNFIWFVGIAHGGIVMSAAIRVIRLEKYKPIARMAELLTVVTLLMAGLSIVMDMGRPDRLFKMIIYYADRVPSSPLVWDLTVIMIYITLSVIYLYLLMREDLAYLRTRLPRFRILYTLLLFGYRENEKEKIERIAWWIALTLLVIVFLLSGGVIPWLFGLIAAQAGWFGAIQGPMYLAAALSSALAAIIVTAAVMRKAFHWEAHIDISIFRGMGTALSVLVILYLWFTLHEQLTMQYAAPSSEHDISDAMLFGSYAPFYWPVIAMMLGTFGYLAGSALAKRFSLVGTVAASAVVLVAFWLKRFLIVVPSLTHPRLELYPEGIYVPTWVEYSLVAGTIGIAVFLILLFIKLFPVMEIKEAKGVSNESGDKREA
ncbi:MAG: hypothetical protein A3K60_04295 [Euryarchaeota archaeon RBG_19FT_COMBO_56_21]|nr:MAG: hypothetical protein A3K60_04295 [Euryarchaeota archaeon RBG_19FT_COMBO_56_21]